MSQERGGDRWEPGPDPAGSPPGWSPSDPGPPWTSPSLARPADDGRPGPPAARPRHAGIPLRPLGIGDILDGTFTTIRRNPRATLGLAAVLVTVQQALAAAAQLGTEGLPSVADLSGESFSVELIGGYGGIVGALISAVIGAVLTGMLVVVVSEDVLGRQVTVAQVWARVRPRIWALLLASALAGLLPYAGLILLVVPGIILWGGWALTTPALVLEGIGPFRALRRSWRLAWPAFGRVWGVRTLSRLLGALIQYLVAVPFVALGIAVTALLGGDEGDRLSVLALIAVVLGGIAAGTLTAPFLAGVLALLYLDRRMRAEGLDIVVRRQARRERSGELRLPGPPAQPVRHPGGAG
jgi:hypothetical protein